MSRTGEEYLSSDNKEKVGLVWLEQGSIKRSGRPVGDRSWINKRKVGLTKPTESEGQIFAVR